jgi:hypothetical protein|tara:strand:+ start:141 stop:458 length:318 start_codon:yes stop_codon:yes gene_type:complete
MLRDATSWITTSKTLSGKLARHERALAVAMEGGVFNGRIDYTKGALVNIDNEGAVAEETSLAPSITGTDHASEGTYRFMRLYVIFSSSNNSTSVCTVSCESLYIR